jgi:DNA-nicking Smr family endonuclease
LRTVLVITGKGGFGDARGVLREAVPRWLNEGDLRPRVLSCAWAQPKHGGAGALYVLLRRQR